MAIKKFTPKSPDTDLGKVAGDTTFARFAHLNRLIDDINKVTVKTTSNATKLGLDPVSMGPKVVFTKPDYSHSKDVIIPGVLELTRGDYAGLYNAATDTSWDNAQLQGPRNTEWNSKYTDNALHGWHPLTNLTDRTYDEWRNAVDGWPNHNIGEELVLHETTTNTYVLIKFLSWTSQGNGGGFSYERYILSSEVSVVREDYHNSFVDIIEPGKTSFKRDSQGGGIYNSALEKENDGNNSNNDSPAGEAYRSPIGTEWNSEYVDNTLYGFSDVSNVDPVKYGTMYDALNEAIGNNIVGTELIMHDLSTDKYYKFLFSNWTNNGNGGGMSYTRQLIPLDEAITFADGTVLKSVNDISAGGGGGGSYNQSLNTSDDVDFNTVDVTNALSADTVWARSNGTGDNVKIGDDCWIGDVDMANGFVVKGVQNLSQAYIKLGNNPNAPVIGNKGSQRFNIAKRDGTAVVAEYTDNAAALAAGLAIGDVYRTGDLLKIVH